MKLNTPRNIISIAAVCPILTDMQETRARAATFELDESATSTLEEILTEIVDQDSELKLMMRAEVIDPKEVIERSKAALREPSFDLASKLHELNSAERERDTALQKSETWYLVGGLSMFACIAALLALFVVGLAKWSGHLLDTGLWPFSIAIGVLAVSSAGFLTLASIREAAEKRANTPATVIPENRRRSLRAQLRSLVVLPTIEGLISFTFVPPAEDIVRITDAAYLSSRVEASGRIETASYREVFTNLVRDGGATVGLAGDRGAGKSELLRAFCETPQDKASVERGGIIGIVVPAPVAYDPEQFLRLLIRRLAEAVPNYGSQAIDRLRKSNSIVNAVILILAVVAIATGAVLVFGLPSISRHTIGWALIAAGTAVSCTVLWFWVLRRATRRRKISPSERGAQINMERREQLADTAAKVARRIRYVETRSVSLEASASWQGSGFTRTSGVSLDQVPWTEADLVLELTNLVNELRKGGYEVRIGIDELDKLASGKDAEKFLTGIKILFPIRDCSFLVTVSEDAAAQFAMRGMPIRDMFESSFDTVVTVEPLTYREARRLIRARHSVDLSETISDTQCLLCYCLSGGLPREFLRFCRQLGYMNSDSRFGGSGKLEKILDELLYAEIRARVNGIRSALRSRNENNAGAMFAELDLIVEKVGSGMIISFLNEFILTDQDFADQALSGNAVMSSSHPAPGSADWFLNIRRQLCAYLYFADTLSQEFGRDGNLSHGGVVAVSSELVDQFESLAHCKRRVEMDAAAGWRGITQVRAALGLARVANPVRTNVRQVPGGHPMS
jgi:membrane protein implicated in regulation of membrane protease activity